MGVQKCPPLIVITEVSANGLGVSLWMGVVRWPLSGGGGGLGDGDVGSTMGWDSLSFVGGLSRRAEARRHPREMEDFSFSSPFNLQYTFKFVSSNCSGHLTTPIYRDTLNPFSEASS